MSLCHGCEKNPAHQICGDCRQTLYCSKECQTLHWKKSHFYRCDVNQVVGNETAVLPPPMQKEKGVKSFSFMDRMDRLRESLEKLVPMDPNITKQIRAQHGPHMAYWLEEVVDRERQAYYRYTMSKRIVTEMLVHLKLDPKLIDSILEDLDGPSEEILTNFNARTFMSAPKMTSKMEESMNRAFLKVSLAKGIDPFPDLSDEWMIVIDLFLDSVEAQIMAYENTSGEEDVQTGITEQIGMKPRVPRESLPRKSKSLANAFIGIVQGQSLEEIEGHLDDAEAHDRVVHSDLVMDPFAPVSEDFARRQVEELKKMSGMLEDIVQGEEGVQVVRYMIQQAEVRSTSYDTFKKRAWWIGIAGLTVTALGGGYAFYRGHMPGPEAAALLSKINPFLKNVNDFHQLIGEELHKVALKASGVLDIITSRQTELAKQFLNLPQINLQGSNVTQVVTTLSESGVSVEQIRSKFIDFAANMVNVFRQDTAFAQDFTRNTFIEMFEKLQRGFSEAGSVENIIERASDFQNAMNLINRNTVGIDTQTLVLLVSSISELKGDLFNLTSGVTSIIGNGTAILQSLSAYGVQPTAALPSPSNITSLVEIGKPKLEMIFDSSLSLLANPIKYGKEWFTSWACNQIMNSQQVLIGAVQSLIESGIFNDYLAQPGIGAMFDGPTLMANTGLFLLRATKYSIMSWWLVEKALALGSLAAARWAEPARNSIYQKSFGRQDDNQLTMEAVERLVVSGVVFTQERHDRTTSKLMYPNSLKFASAPKYAAIAEQSTFFQARSMQRFLDAGAGLARYMTRSAAVVSSALTAGGVTLIIARGLSAWYCDTHPEVYYWMKPSAQIISYTGMLLVGTLAVTDRFTNKRDPILSMVNYRISLPKRLLDKWAPPLRGDNPKTEGFDRKDYSIVLLMLFVWMVEFLSCNILGKLHSMGANLLNGSIPDPD